MSRITITSVGEAVKQGKFFYVPLEYNDKGKDFKKKIMDFANKEIYATMKQAKVGEQYDIAVEKDNNGYWQWKTASLVAANSAPAAGTNSAGTVRSTYETPEERAVKQVLIVRQSCLAQAVALLGNSLIADVLDVAEQFADWVMQPTKENS